MSRETISEKIIVLGVDGMDPRLTRKYMDMGLMPNTKKIMERGSAREDLVMLGAMPTITPPMWTTLATGAYPMTHGIIDYNMNMPDAVVMKHCGIGGDPLWECQRVNMHGLLR